MNRHGKRFAYPDYGRDEILRDFASHRLTVQQDDGLHRHLRFRNPESGTYWFDIVTWTGALVINGDCGCYAFSRIPDMFAFFRADKDGHSINPGYWAEKLLATDRCDGHHEYSEQKGRAAVASAARALRERGAPTDVVRDFRESVEIDGGADALFHSVDRWSSPRSEHPHDGWRVECFYEHDVKDFTRRFLWNLHAIVWGIAQYDATNSILTAGATA